MNIYEFSYAAAVICYRNIEALEERHAVCGEADEELYEIIESEFSRRFDMLLKVIENGASNEEEESFLFYLAVCIRGYKQWDIPRQIFEPMGDDYVEYVLKKVRAACLRHERLTEGMMKQLNKSVHDRLFTWLMNNY